MPPILYGYSRKMSTRDELRRIEEDLARLRAENRDIREQIRDMGATDQMERAAVISAADEQVELIAGLERRRDALLARLEKEESASG
jgi:hypothetical protein